MEAVVYQARDPISISRIFPPGYTRQEDHLALHLFDMSSYRNHGGDDRRLTDSKKVLSIFMISFHSITHTMSKEESKAPSEHCRARPFTPSRIRSNWVRYPFWRYIVVDDPEKLRKSINSEPLLSLCHLCQSYERRSGTIHIKVEIYLNINRR